MVAGLDGAGREQTLVLRGSRSSGAWIAPHPCNPVALGSRNLSQEAV